MTVFFSSMGKKNFEFKENHSVTFWADGAKIETENPFWKESDGGTAFVISRIAFAEQVWIGMKNEQFLKLAKAKKVKIHVGKFKFEMTDDQREGFAAIAERFEQISK